VGVEGWFIEQFNSIGLRGFTFITFGAFLVIGVFASRLKIWNGVDILYYPMAAIGVILLFNQNQDARSLFHLDSEKIAREELIAKIELNKPKIEGYIPDEKYIAAFGRNLDFISQKASFCNRYGWSIGCTQMEAVGKISLKYESTFKNVKGAEGLQKLCDSAIDFMDEIKEDRAINSYIYSLMKKHYLKLIDGTNYITSHKYIENKVNVLLDKIDTDNKKILHHGGFNKESKDRLTKLYKIESEIVEHIMFGYSVCWNIPQDIRNGKYKAWIDKFENEKKEYRNVEGEITQLKKSSKEEKSALPFDHFIWPYLIILALALKFGKAIAGISKRVPTITNCFNILCSGLVKLIGKLLNLLKKLKLSREKASETEGD
jgi:hypothetical protein